MKRNKIVRVILTSLAIILFACMAMGSNFSEKNKEWDNKLKNDEKFKDYCVYINSSVEACTGTCLTREEMAQLVYNYEKVQINAKEEEVFDLQLQTPGEHKHDEKTRYSITTLETNEYGVYKGLKVSVMDDVSACKIEEAGLPVKEIIGTYEIVSEVKIQSGDSEFVQELTWTFNVDAVEGNTIAIKMEGVRFGEGLYDPASGVCEVKIAPEWFEAMHTEPRDGTERFTFSKQDGKIQFEMIELGKEDAVPGIAYKVE